MYLYQLDFFFFDSHPEMKLKLLGHMEFLLLILFCFVLYCLRNIMLLILKDMVNLISFCHSLTKNMVMSLGQTVCRIRSCARLSFQFKLFLQLGSSKSPTSPGYSFSLTERNWTPISFCSLSLYDLVIMFLFKASSVITWLWLFLRT